MKIYVPFSSHATVCSSIFFFTWESCPDIDFLLYYRNYRRHKKCEKSLQNDKIGRVIELINFFTTTTAAVLLISDSLELFFHFSLYYYHHVTFLALNKPHNVFVTHSPYESSFFF